MVDWTDQRIELVKKLWDDGLSCSQIAAEIGDGASRNSVIGKVTRLGLNKRRQGVGPRQFLKPERTKKDDAPRAKRKRVNRLIRTNSFSGDLRVIKLDPNEIPVEQRKQLLELGSNDCRWPYGDVGGPDFFFCAGPKIDGCSYCEMHQRAAKGRRVNPTDAQRFHSMMMRRAKHSNRFAMGD